MSRSIIALVFILLALAGCGDSSTATRENDFVDLTALTLSSPLSRLAQDTSVQLTATGDFSGEFTKDLTANTIWESSNPNILAIDEAGRARGIAPGTATATGQHGPLSDTLELTVTDARIVTVAVDPAAAAVPVGFSQSFAATGTFSDGTVQIVTADVDWISDNPTVAAVDLNGDAFGLAPGVAGVFARFPAGGSVEAQGAAELTIKEIQSVTLAPAQATLIPGQAQVFTATGGFADGSSIQLSPQQLTWTSDHPEFVTVDANGRATAVAAGNATITATFGTTPGTAAVTVTAPTTVTVSNPNRNLAPGDSVTLTATATFANNQTQDVTSQAAWSSSDTTVATVSSLGTVTAVAAGQTTITATYGGKSGDRPITVQ